MNDKIKEAIENAIKPDDFCQLVSDKFDKWGMPEGSYVYVASTKALPESEEDIYWQRIKMICHPARPDEEDLIDTTKLVFIDPSNLVKVDDDMQVAFKQKFMEQFEVKED